MGKRKCSLSQDIMPLFGNLAPSGSGESRMKIEVEDLSSQRRTKSCERLERTSFPEGFLHPLLRLFTGNQEDSGSIRASGGKELLGDEIAKINSTLNSSESPKRERTQEA